MKKKKRRTYRDDIGREAREDQKAVKKLSRMLVVDSDRLITAENLLAQQLHVTA